jgi:hypothetical protein
MLEFSWTQDGYQSGDISVTARHLFEKNDYIDMGYAKSPDDLVLFTRDDGVLSSMTLKRGQEVFGWSRQVTDGQIESVVTTGAQGASITPHIGHVVVKREIDGSTVRYIERLETWETDVYDSFYVDSGLSFVGARTEVEALVTVGSPNVLVSPVAWSTDFVGGAYLKIYGAEVRNTAGDVVEYLDDYLVWAVRNATTTYVDLYDPNDHAIEIDFKVRHPTETLALAPIPIEEVDEETGFGEMQVWYAHLASDTFTGLDHLEGEEVAVLADAEVAPRVTVSGGQVTIAYPAGRVHIGMPYTAKMETLDLVPQGDPAGESSSRRGINDIAVYVKDTQSLQVGTNIGDLTDAQARDAEPEDAPSSSKTQFIEITPEGTWDDEVRVRVEQSDPIALRVLSVVPSYELGEGQS